LKWKIEPAGPNGPSQPETDGIELLVTRIPDDQIATSRFHLDNQSRATNFPSIRDNDMLRMVCHLAQKWA
jgi:hypothetical protein